MPRLFRGALCSSGEEILIHSLIYFMPKQVNKQTLFTGTTQYLAMT